MKSILNSLALLCLLFYTQTTRAEDGEKTIKKGPPEIELVEIMPSDGGNNLYYMRCVAPAKGQDASGQFTVRFTIRNKESKTLTLTSVKYYFSSGPTKFNKTMKLDHEDPKVGSIKIAKGKDLTWQNNRAYHKVDNAVLFSENLAISVSIHLKFKGYDEPYVISRDLKPYTNLTPGGSYRFPGKESDLRVNEYWYTYGGHGGGGQFYAYDFVVRGWDPVAKKWTNKFPGTDGSKNEHYLAYGKSIIAAADGEVIEVNEGKDENEGNKGGGSGGGNSIKIYNGKETMCYYHMQKNSINKKFLTIGAKVKKGEFIGLLGNSGSSSEPHGHIHVIDDPDGDGQGEFRPLNFSEMHVIDPNAMSSPNPNAGWVKVTDRGLPFLDGRRLMIWPSEDGPKWYPRGKSEVSRRKISAKSYQSELQKIWDCGYYPVWVDAYEVKGDVFFNVVAHPRRAGLDIEVRHGLTGKDFGKEYDKWVEKKGYRLLQLETYNASNKLRYAAIFIKRAGKAEAQPAYNGVSASKHQELFEKYTGMGFVPVNVSVTSIKNTRYYSAFYEKRDVGSVRLKSSLSQQEYQDQFEEMSSKGWEQVYINANTHKGKTEFSVIWYQDAGNNKLGATRKSDSEGFQKRYDQYIDNNFRTRCVTGYGEGKSHYFAGLWLK
jgi:hypothetical protein